MHLDQVREYGIEFERRLRLRTYPLGIKLIERDEDIPADAKRPLRDFGAHFDLCQLYATSRREGLTIVAKKGDHWCPEPVIGYGLAEPPQEFLDGHNRYPQDVATLQAGKNYARDFPRLPTGRYVGVMSAPLGTIPVVPDVIVLYVDTEQLSLLMLAREHRDGNDLPVRMSSHAACVYGVVPSISTGECQVALPCRGYRYLAMAGNDEMIFSIPCARVEEIIIALRFLEKRGSSLPRNYRMKPEPAHIESYLALSRQMGVLRPDE